MASRKLTLMPRREEGINKQKTRYLGLGDIKTFKGELGGGGAKIKEAILSIHENPVVLANNALQ